MDMSEMGFQSTADHPAVLRLQIERYRKMSNEERLETGLRMWEFARDLIVASIRNESPGLSDAELNQKVTKRMSS